MDLYYRQSVLKQLRKIPKKELPKILKKLTQLPKDPYSGKALKGELRGLYSLRVWPYRIIYEISSGRVIIYSVAHRQAVYK